MTAQQMVVLASAVLAMFIGSVRTRPGRGSRKKCATGHHAYPWCRSDLSRTALQKVA